MKLSYKFKVLTMNEDKLRQEAVAVAEAGDLEKLEYLHSKNLFEVGRAIIEGEADLPEASRLLLNKSGYTEIGKYLLAWKLTSTKSDKTKTVAVIIDNGLRLSQHRKDSLLANALEAPGGNASSPMAEMLIQKGADLEAATALVGHRYKSFLNFLKDNPVSREVLYAKVVALPPKESKLRGIAPITEDRVAGVPFNPAQKGIYS